jgi:hypothetical protein
MATYTIYVCPDCGEHITESDYDPSVGRIWGHYHDPPEGWPEGEDPWIDAVALEVAPVATVV